MNDYSKTTLNTKHTLAQVSGDEWDRFALNWQAQDPSSPAGFSQSQNMADYLRENGQKTLPLILKNESGEGLAGGLFSLYPAMKIFRVAKCNQGPLIDYLDRPLVLAFFKKVKALLQKQGVIELTITPNIECGENFKQVAENLADAGLDRDGFDNGYLNGVGRWFFVKDFSRLDTPEQLWSSYTGKTRNRVKKAEKYSIHCREIEEDEFEIFAELMEKTAERRDFVARPAEYYRQFLKSYNRGASKAMIVLAYIEPEEALYQLGQERAEIEGDCRQLEAEITAGTRSKRSEGKLKSRRSELDSCDKNIATIRKLLDRGPRIYLSGATFVTYNGEMTYLFSGSYEEFYGLCAAQLLQHYAQTRGLEEGIRSYNYYGTTGKHSGQEDEGVLDFKRGFGGRLLEQPGNFSQVLRSPWGQIYRKSFK